MSAIEVTFTTSFQGQTLSGTGDAFGWMPADEAIREVVDSNTRAGHAMRRAWSRAFDAACDARATA